MSDIGIGLYIRVVFLIIGVFILFAGTGSLVYFWKKLDIGQRLFVIGTLLLQLCVLDALREAINNDIEWRWRMVIFVLAELAFLTDLIFPLSRKRRSLDDLSRVIQRDRYTD